MLQNLNVPIHSMVEKNNEILPKIHIDEEVNDLLQSFRIAALCHDIGHGPFSHIFEGVCKNLNQVGLCDEFKHEKKSAQIIKSKLGELIPEESHETVIGLLINEGKKYEYLHRIINGPYDIDKLDYVSRDSYHSGALEYGKMNYDRIIDGLRMKDDYLYISTDTIESVINTFTATQYMYLGVYYHKTARIFDFMLSDAMELVPDYLNEIINDDDVFLETDDFSFINYIKHKSDKPPFTDSYQILKNVLDRKKMYFNIYRKIISLDLTVEKDDKIQKISDELIEKYEDLNLKIDFAGKVKPIRIDSDKIYAWLSKNNFYDDATGKVFKMIDVSRAYYNMLVKMQVVYFIFVDQAHSHDPRIDDIRREINDALTELESEEA